MTPLITAGKSAISAVATAADRKAFLDLPYRAYRNDPAWRAPLLMERATQIDPKHNPALAAMEHVFFLARKDGEVVGRIAAFINPAHLARHQDATGHFGFLDTTTPDAEVLTSLMAAAEGWLATRGMKRIAGPFNFSVNEECGLLVDGFDTPPMVMMLHGRPDYAVALSSAGYAKAIDLHAYFHKAGETYTVPPSLQKLLDAAGRIPSLTIRPMNMKDFKADVGMIMDIFNDAWSENWGFVPFSAEQINTMASELKPLMTSDGMWVALLDGEPAGFALFLPDLNELTQGMNGKLLPFGWAQLLWGLKVRGATRARLPLAGLRRRYHKTKRGALAMASVFEAAFAAQHKRGVREIEASWVLETNRDLIAILEFYEMKRYKTFRLFEKAL
jgi:GNAT superfamily N-acetyltransferase